jgi:AraC-like DNA-binding protein
MFVSVIFVRGILAELHSQGHSRVDIVHGLGVHEDLLSDLRARIAGSELERMIVHATELSGDPGLGLSMGARAPESMLQILGYLLLSCRTLREACAVLSRYAVLTVDGASWQLSEQDGVATFAFACPLAAGATSRFASEFVLAMATRIAGHFISQRQARSSGRLLAVHFQHEAPGYAERYQHVFHREVMFRQAENALVFPAQWLDVPQFHGDPLINLALRDTAERLLSELERPATLSDRVRAVLRSEAILNDVEIGKLARAVGLTRRALRRRLAAEGTSFTALVDEARCKLACDELRREGSIRNISERVGYSEPSAFHRAFRRWTGQTPNEFARGA